MYNVCRERLRPLSVVVGAGRESPGMDRGASSAHKTPDRSLPVLIKLSVDGLIKVPSKLLEHLLPPSVRVS